MLRLLKSPWTQSILLTFLCIGVFFGIRALPIPKCNLLHLKSDDVLDDGVEFCGNDHFFLNLNEVTFPVSVAISTDEAIEVGKENEYTLTLMNAGGRPMLPYQLAVTHTKKLHLLLVDSSLEDYHHIHPVPMGETGEWVFKFKPNKPGVYRAFAEIVPIRTRQHVVAPTEITVPGEPELPAKHYPMVAEIEDYRFSLDLNFKDARAYRDNNFTLTVTRKDGKPLILETIMGTFAHLVAFDEKREGYSHMHPLSIGKEKDPHAPALAFIFNTKQTGFYRIWAQVQLEGREIFAPFDLSVDR